MKMTVQKVDRPLQAPFKITGFTFTAVQAVWVVLEEDGFVGRGEGVSVYYQGETQESLVSQLKAVKDHVEAGASHHAVLNLLPPGGARNALDCAMWDLSAKRLRKSVWELLDIKPKALSSVATIGIDSPAEMGQQATHLKAYPNLKVKLNAEDPIARLAAVRNARPEAQLIIDVNQGWNMDQLVTYMADLQALGIAMVEQPLPRHGDDELMGYKSPIPLGADESCLDLSEYETAAKRYDVINIKLDKCGGLSQGLEIVNLCRRDGKGVMIGNMTGTSLSMAPAYVIGQFCQFVDIDGPVFLQSDIEHALEYSEGGMVSIPGRQLWG